MIVLDTSAVLRWVFDDKQLSALAAQAITQADRILVSSISLWEIGIKVQRRKLAIPISVHELAARLHNTERVEVLAVDEQTWLANLELPWEHRDPADRTIVATARLLGCPLVTSDGPIHKFYPNAIW